MAGPSRTIIPKNPIAWACSSGGNVSRMMACAMGWSAPPPRPCSTRNRISCPSVRDRPHITDAPVKIATERRYMRCRPSTVPSHAVSGMMITTAMR